MNIREIKDRKKKLEDAIAHAVNQFAIDTYTIPEVEVICWTSETVDGGRRFTHADVKVVVRL